MSDDFVEQMMDDPRTSPEWYGLEPTAPKGDLPDDMTINGHLFVHVGACPCPRIQAEMTRLGLGRDLSHTPEDMDR